MGGPPDRGQARQAPAASGSPPLAPRGEGQVRAADQGEGAVALGAPGLTGLLRVEHRAPDFTPRAHPPSSGDRKAARFPRQFPGESRGPGVAHSQRVPSGPRLSPGNWNVGIRRAVRCAVDTHSPEVPDNSGSSRDDRVRTTSGVQQSAHRHFCLSIFRHISSPAHSRGTFISLK